MRYAWMFFFYLSDPTFLKLCSVSKIFGVTSMFDFLSDLFTRLFRDHL